jgi:REP element-mobilizing transposase RayT
VISNSFAIMETFNLQGTRNSRMEMNEVYFWTSSIKDWKKLLAQDKYKILIIGLLQELVQKELISVFGFVLMPNHIHLVWEILKKNGRESPLASFQKASSHLIIKDLKENHPNVLPHFSVTETDREFRIWQRDPLAIFMDTKIKVSQKLDYIHTNPLQGHWNLASRPEDYFWSSASFYENGDTRFSFLTRFEERFG